MHRRGLRAAGAAVGRRPLLLLATLVMCVIHTLSLAAAAAVVEAEERASEAPTFRSIDHIGLSH